MNMPPVPAPSQVPAPKNPKGARLAAALKKMSKGPIQNG